MDDEEIIRESVGDFLIMKGYEVEHAEDGNKAIELYEKALETSVPFVAVIRDLTIRGGMGGKEAVKKLQEINPDVKTIVSSGYSNDPVMANFREYGFSDVFNKASNSPDYLCRILNRVIKEYQ
jgi:DNA-binding NtrC family response regulator